MNADDVGKKDIAAVAGNGMDDEEMEVNIIPSTLVRQPHASYFDRYIASLGNDETTRKTVEDSYTRLAEKLQVPQNQRVTGLVVGRVQSGKTRNYIGLMLKAVDEGWNAVVILTSDNAELGKQTRNRINGVLRDKKKGLGLTARDAAEVKFAELSFNQIEAGDAFENDYFYWGVAIKEPNNLEKVKRWCELSTKSSNNVNLLIIDDEADNATQDTNYGSENILDNGKRGGKDKRNKDVDNSEDIEDSGGCELIEALNFIQDEIIKKWLFDLFECDDLVPDTASDEYKTFEEFSQKVKSRGAALKRNVAAMFNSADTKRFARLLRCEGDVETDGAPMPMTEYISSWLEGSRKGADELALYLKSIFDISRQRSAINNAICSLVGCANDGGAFNYNFRNCAYVGYTATPYACIFNEVPGHTPLYANYIQSLPAGKQYFGLERICGLPDDDDNDKDENDLDENPPKANMPIVKTISVEERDNFVQDIQYPEVSDDGEKMLPVIDGDLNLVGTRHEWYGLREAICWSFCAAAARRAYRFRREEETSDWKPNRETCYTTMLFNIDHRKDVHAYCRGLVDSFLNSHCAGADEIEEFIESCHNVWIRFTDEFTKEKFSECIADYGCEIDDYPSWEEVANELRYFVHHFRSKVQVVIINSEASGAAGKIAYNAAIHDDYESCDKLWIVCGGNTISRGLTLDGLVASYFDRVKVSTAVDTMVQMGRWFGYRPGYELLPRVWFRGSTLAEFKKSAYTEKEMHILLDRNFKAGYDPTDPTHYAQIPAWNRALSGRRGAISYSSTGIGSCASIDEISVAPKDVEAVWKATDSLVRDLKSPKMNSDSISPRTPYWENVSIERMVQYFTEVQDFMPKNSAKELSKVISDMRESSETNWDVIIGQPTRSQDRTEYEIGGLDLKIYGGKAKGESCGGQVRSYSAQRLYHAYYAMIPYEYVYETDLEYYKQFAAGMAAQLCNADTGDVDEEKISRFPYLKKYECETPKDAIIVHVSKLAEALARYRSEKDAGRDAVLARVDESFHYLLDKPAPGIRNRSNEKYINKVHANAGHKRPMLQLRVIDPADGVSLPEKMGLIYLSVYWPNHTPPAFQIGTVQGPRQVKYVTADRLRATIRSCLEKVDAIVRIDKVREDVLTELKGEATPQQFKNNFNPATGCGYKLITSDNKPLYLYSDKFAASDEEALVKMKVMLGAAAKSVIAKDYEEHQGAELYNAALVEDRRLIARYVRDDKSGIAEMNMVLASLIQEDDCIAVTRIGRGVTYRHLFRKEYLQAKVEEIEGRLANGKSRMQDGEFNELQKKLRAIKSELSTL